MPQQPHRPEALAWQIFLGSWAVRRGLLTAHQLRSSAWVRILHDVYADARLDRDHELKCRAAALCLPPLAVFSGPSAARLDGLGYAAGFSDEVHVTVPTKVRVGPRLGLRIHSTDLDPLDSITRDGLPRTVPARTAWDVGAWLDPVPAVAIIDGLLARGLVEAAELTALADRYADRPWPGSRRARRAFALADPGALGPAESRLRVRLLLARLPRPVPRPAIRLASGLVLHPDLAWPQYRVALETDGWYTDPGPIQRDRRRLDPLVAAGWIVVHVTSQHLRREFPAVVRQLREALVHRGWRP